MAVPIVVLAVAGRLDIALLAASGAFTVIYGGWLRPRQRARFAPIMALALFACAAVGVLAAGGGTTVVLVGALVLTIVAASLAGWPSLASRPRLLRARLRPVRTGYGGPRRCPQHRSLGVLRRRGILGVRVPPRRAALAAAVSREEVRPVRTLFPRRWGGGRSDSPSAPRSSRSSAWARRCSSTPSARTGSSAQDSPSSGCRSGGVRRRHAASIAPSERSSALSYTSASRCCRCPSGRSGWCSVRCRSSIELTVVRHYALALVFITPLVLLIIGAATGEGANVPLALERVVDTPRRRGRRDLRRSRGASAVE
jgi:hypothetical protein